MKAFRVVVAVSVVAVVLASAGVAFAKPLSETQWKKRGNAICKQINTDIDTIGNEVFAGLGPNEQPTDEQVTSFVEQVLPVVEDGVASINKLEEPKSLKKGIKKFNCEVRKLIVKLDTDPTVLLSTPDPFQTVNKAAKAVGLKECANGSGLATQPAEFEGHWGR